VTPAVRELERHGVAFELAPYTHDPTHESYGLEAAEALGVDPSMVFKTLVVTGDKMYLTIVPVTHRVSLKLAAAAIGERRLTMSAPADAERATGYVVGGISPFGTRRRLGVIIDASARDHTTVYVSGGRRGLDICVAVEDLIRICAATVAEIVA